MPEYVVVIYLICINLVGFFSMALDKSRAKRGKWRISEAALFIIAIIGGSLGSIAGMYAFRHKTRHLQFTIGLPVILVIQLAIIIYLLFAYKFALF